MRTGADGSRAIPHLPALDGLRAVALLAVLCFHAGFTWISGGYLPLTSFFVLSGFLITALLLAESESTGRVSLRAFWVRRVRRLAPGALLGLGLVALYAAFGARYEIPGLTGDALSALGWVANWRFIVDQRAYADVFADPSPLQHYWSLAVEEQFYLVLPVVSVACLALARRRRWLLGATAAVGAVASVLVMRAVHEPGDAPLRAYFGTDTRAAELLVGVLLAVVMVDGSGQLRRLRGVGHRLLDGAGALALAATAATWLLVREFDDRLYEGGLVLIALLAAVVVAAGTQERTVVSRLLGLSPLVALGRISYGVYLFHWPLFLWIDEESTGLGPAPLFAVRLVVTVVLAAASYRFIEAPIRRGAGLPRIAAVGWANASVAVAGVITVAAAALPSTGITLRAAGEVGALPPPEVAVPTEADTAPQPTTEDGPTVEAPVAGDGADGAAPTPPAGPRAEAPPTGAAPTSPPPTGSPTPATSPPPPPLRVMLTGDSIAQNLATGLQRVAARTGAFVVYDAARPACPLLGDVPLRSASGQVVRAAAACTAWPTTFPEQVRRFRPDVVVVQTGVGDVYDLEVPGRPGFVEPGHPAHDAYVLSQYQKAVGLLGATGAPVVWTTPPCFRTGGAAHWLDEADDNVAIAHLRSAVVPALVASTGAHGADLFAEVCPDGAFESHLFGQADARPDGLHLTDGAAEVLADRWLAPLLLRLAGR